MIFHTNSIVIVVVIVGSAQLSGATLAADIVSNVSEARLLRRPRPAASKPKARPPTLTSRSLQHACLRPQLQ